MRRVMLAVLLAVLAALVAVRLRTERPAAVAAMAAGWDSGQYNALSLDMPGAARTAGSSLTAELSGWFFSRTPTAKSGYTGLLAGRDLVLLTADFALEEPTEDGAPTLWRLRQEGVRFADVYAPDWYQGGDGRLFALLTGMIPTTVEQLTALEWTGRQGTSLPFCLGVCLTGAGYACRIYPAGPGQEEACRVLGFTPAQRDGDDGQLLCQALSPGDRAGPCAVCLALTQTDAERTLAALWRALEQNGRLGRTVICLWAEGTEPGRGSLYLWAEGLAGAAVSAPCSDLDVTPTLLDLLGADYDGRFLWGRDLLAGDTAGDADWPVCLAGSAFADWVTPAGRYDAAQSQFFPAAGCPFGEKERGRYVAQIRRAVYDRYTYARRVLETNYFRTALEW